MCWPAKPDNSYADYIADSLDNPLAAVKSFCIQLQGCDVAKLAASDFDLIILDPDQVTQADIAALRFKPNGASRILLAYLSVGEAERYRANFHFAKSAAILGAENPEWPENFDVEFWSPDWRLALLDECSRIWAKKFDGVFLDKLDAYLPDHGPRTATNMAALLHFLSRLFQSFLFLGNNPEHAGWLFLDALDGVLKEELFMQDGMLRSEEAIGVDLGWLKPFALKGKPIFLIEYTRSPGSIRDISKAAKARRLVPYFAGEDRLLDRVFS